jgi:hypothetical protein
VPTLTPKRHVFDANFGVFEQPHGSGCLSRTLSFSGLPPTRSRARVSRQRALADDIALKLGLLQFSAKL